MTAMPMEPEPDFGRCEQVKEAVNKVLELSPPNIAWMTGELGHSLLAAFYAAYTNLFMEYLKRGIPQDEAKASAEQQAPLLAFQLGLQVGAEMEANRAMREMFGE